TAADLVQVENLIAEVQTRVRSLARQKKRAERHGEITARRYQLVATLARHDVATIDLTLRQIEERMAQLAEEIPASKSALQERDRERHQAVEARAGAEAQRNAVEKRVGEARMAVMTLESDLTLAAERTQNASARREKARGERADAQAAAVRYE